MTGKEHSTGLHVVHISGAFTVLRPLLHLQLTRSSNAGVIRVVGNDFVSYTRSLFPIFLVSFVKYGPSLIFLF